MLDFEAARSVAAIDGAIAFSHASPDPKIALVDWTANTHRVTSWRVVK